MDQYLNNRQNEILWNLLADPANNGHAYVANLQSLVADFPQSGILHALLAHAEGGQNIGHAAAYVDPKVLYKLTHSPESLAGVTEDQIIQQLQEAVHSTPETIAADRPKVEEVSHLNNFETIVEESRTAIESEVTEPIKAHTEPFSEEDEVVVQPVQEVTADIPATSEKDHHGVHRHDAEASEEMEQKVSASLEAPAEAVDEEPVDFTHYHDAEASEEVEQKVSASLKPPVEAVDEEPEDFTHYHDAEASEEFAHIAHTPAAEQHHEEADSTDPLHKPVYEEEPAAEEEMIEYGPLADEARQTAIEEHREPEVRRDEQLTESPVFALAQPPHNIEDEVFDEIVGIENIRFAHIPKPVESIETVIPHMEMPIIDEETSQSGLGERVKEHVAPKERALNMDDEAEKLIVGNIAATDYFVFDRAFNERKPVDPIETVHHGNENAVTEVAPATGTHDVSKYDDESLPYTFLWWLNKTRKEHAGVYQPFKLDTTQAIQRHAADELQQQYYENIFHLTSVEELDRSTVEPALEFDPKRKEDRIIKKFITEEPQITPPSLDKIDNENKAKRSSEDQDEFVSETLARVYVDQMLYHKAINTYKKLMLKFPEKSRYFADQIEILERKIN
ncbi:MAG: hypothetical protein JO080_16095 [Mucilaginibacter sp.]|nr:hypothetical protein [Mucilaginibacter sp.]